MSFWNDLLRNEDGVTYFSENAGRKSITPWLLPALRDNLPYDRFVAALINPGERRRSRGLPHRRQLARRDQRRGDAVDAGGAEHVAGVPRRQPEVRVVPRQLRQQVEAEGRLRAGRLLLAGAARCRCIRCDLPQDEHTGPGFLFPGLRAHRRDRSSLADRRAAAAAIFTDPRLGRLPRTLVNRVWQRLLGRGIVATVDEMDGEPWSPALLDWLASDFVGARLRRQAPDRDHRDVARVPDAGGAARGRAAGPRLRVPRPGGAAPDRGAVRRRHRLDHRRVERARRLHGRRGRRAARRARRGRARCRRSRPSAGVRGARMAGAVDHADARPRPADPRSDHLDSRRPTRRRCRRWS